MKARIFLIAALLAGGFYYVTSVADLSGGKIFATRTVGTGPLWSGPDVAQSAGLSADELNNIEIYKRAHNATVNITSTVYRQGWFMEIYPTRNAGSGFIVDERGHIITNWHVVDGVEKGGEILVTLADKQKYKAQLLERDPGNDLALIKINPKTKVNALRMGDSEALQVGQKVLAIGNPFGLLEGSLTTGIISSLHRTIQDESQRELEGLIQTDAAINPGNSGGPLLDSQGNVIGVNTAIYGPGSNIGIGFAMPISKAKLMLDDYQAGRRYAPPRLGVSVVYISGGFAEALGLPEVGGLLVQGITPGSAAQKAGIRPPREVRIVGQYEVGVGGDLIMEVDGRPCDRPDAISRILSRHRAGDTIEVKVFRGGKAMTIKVTLDALPDSRI
jgi:S1-C subfamily serine protease